MHEDFEQCYRAVSSRDPRFDGRVYTAVMTTGIYCRPSCPARTPLRRNVRFYASAAAASAAGFRACRRCRPDTLPGSREWDHRGDLAARALRLVAAGDVDEHGVSGLARRLAVSERHLHRVLVSEVGVGPLALARTRRAQTARLLVDQTDLPLADVAFAAGFASVRQFNDVMREEFGCSPSELRRRPDDDGRTGSGTLTLRLAHRPPYSSDVVLSWLAARAIPGLEVAEPGGHTRVLSVPGGEVVARLVPGDDGWQVSLTLGDLRGLRPAVAAIRRLLDLDSDPQAVDAVLARDPALRSSVRRRSGIRVPGCVDGFELAVRAVLGQQVSVGAARTFAGRLVAAHGKPAGADGDAVTHAFPTAEVLVDADLSGIGLTGSRVRTLRALATACTDGLVLDPGADRDDVRRRLLALPGIGPWTADYVAMRALGDPDAFPETDLVLRRVVAARQLDPDRWRPWRAYAAMHLWSSEGDEA